MLNHVCSVINCLDEYYAKGYCRKHYQRNKIHGVVTDGKNHHGQLETRLYSQVDKNGENITDVGTPCWNWLGFKRKGYGSITANNVEHRTHRASWELSNGIIPENLCVLHKCDNPACINPEHLFLGTAKDNAEDKVNKGRAYSGDHKGEKSGLAKITEDIVLKIRDDTRMQKDIAAIYGLDKSTISDIKRRKTWNHI